MNVQGHTPYNKRRGFSIGMSFAAIIVGLAGASQLAAQPNLVVRIDGTEIDNHHEHAFPDTEVGESVQLIVVLRNEGNETLQFTEDPPIMMAGGFPDSFELVQPALEPGNTLSPNGSTAFAVRFQPEFVTTTTLFTHIYIWTNASAAPFHLNVRGNVLGPQMVVTLAGETIPDLGTAVFPNTRVGETSTLLFTIENQGNGDLDLTETPPIFLAGGLGEFVMEITQQPVPVIGPGEASQFSVEFTPTEARLYITRLFINVNENSANVNTLYDIDLEGTGTIVDCNSNGIDDANELGSNDCNGNGVPDDCENDSDSDNVIDVCDNCPDVANPDQADSDGNGVGDACDVSDDAADDVANEGTDQETDETQQNPNENLDEGADENDAPNEQTDDNVQQDQPITDANAEEQITDDPSASESINDTEQQPGGIFGLPLCGNGFLALLPLTMLGLAGLKPRYARRR